MNKLNSLKIKYLFGMFFLQTCSFQSIFRLLTIGFSISILFSSCRENNERNDNTIVGYSIDTVLIDAKGRIFDLDRDIFVSDFNENLNTLFLFNKFDYSIDELNLDELNIVKNYPFDLEGPDGIGEYVGNIVVLQDSSLFIKSDYQSAIFKRNGRLETKIDWVNAIDSNCLNYGQIPRVESVISKDDLRVFGLSIDELNGKFYIDILNVQDSLVKRHDVDFSNSYHNFILQFNHPTSRTYMDPTVFLRSENVFILVSHQYSNEIILFNSKGELEKIVNYNPKLTPSRAKDLDGLPLESADQIGDEYQKLLEQVRFGPPVWDGIKKRYFRLSATRFFSDNRGKNTLLPEIIETKVYISVFDENFNLVSELSVPELNSESRKYFAKDGKLWVSQNFSDELGFIVVDVKEN
jgi:hypothetical protein